MSKPFIVVGDKIDHGGAVVSSTATTDINGLPVARRGDKTACGATLIAASQIQVFVDSGGGSGASGRQAGKASSLAPASAGAAASAINDGDGGASDAKYDEQIQFVNANGAKLAGVGYLVTLESGEILQGTTDAEGRTGRMATAQPTRIVSAELSASQRACCGLHAAQGASMPLILQVSAATNAKRLGRSIQQVATPAGKARGLTPGEIAMARLVFADSVDYSRVKVHNGEYLWFGMQQNDTAMTPNGEMYFNESYFEEDFSVKRIGLQHWFIHEMTHVWQYQLGYPVKLRGAVRIGLSYRYELAPGKRLGDYNMEAQGNILADYFLIKFRNAPGAISERRYAGDPNALQRIEVVLADFLHDPGNEGNL